MPDLAAHSRHHTTGLTSAVLVAGTRHHLRADNGLGVATALALLDLPETAKLPPLECLFTTDEETGLTGAPQV